VALRWSSDPRLHFLEGRILFESGKQSEGLSEMRVAIQAQPAEAPTMERLFLAEALVQHGGNQERSDALRLLEEVVPRASGLTRGQVDTYCTLALELREYTGISKVLDKCDNNTYLYWIVEQLRPSLDDRMLVYSCGSSLVHALGVAAKGRDLSEDDRRTYQTEAARIQSMLKQLT
jgi:hypothetical protein